MSIHWWGNLDGPDLISRFGDILKWIIQWREIKTCRWTQLKFYWTLVKIINKWIHCHHVRNQWTKTMHYYVCFNVISICFVLSTFISAFTTTEIRSTFAMCGSNLGDIPNKWIRAHVWGLSLFPTYYMIRRHSITNGFAISLLYVFS